MRPTQIFEHFQKSEKRRWEKDEDENKSLNKQYLKRSKNKSNTKYRDHFEYQNIFLFFPDDTFKQKWDILILAFVIVF